MVSSQFEPVVDEALADLAQQAAKFDREMENGPRRSIAEEETGLSASTIDALVSEGIDRSELRRVGRRLAQLGRERDVQLYRRLFGRARALGTDVLALLELEIVD